MVRRPLAEGVQGVYSLRGCSSHHTGEGDFTAWLYQLEAETEQTLEIR